MLLEHCWKCQLSLKETVRKSTRQLSLEPSETSIVIETVWMLLVKKDQLSFDQSKMSFVTKTINEKCQLSLKRLEINYSYI